MAISHSELTIDDEVQHEHFDEPTLDAEATGGTEATAKAEPAAVSAERESGQTLDDLPRDRDPRWGYIELAAEEKPTANAAPTEGTKAPAEPTVHSGEDKTGQTSERKREANRRNAQLSTGPKTPRGKAYSRKNAIKHGLFTRDMWEFATLGESQAEYDLLLDDLHKKFEPIGRAEELEVERIAVCWWRLQRAWRYENSVNQNSWIRAAKELEQFENSCKALDQEREAIIRGLENMVAELSVAREVPPDLKQKFFVLTSAKEQDWQCFEEMGEETLKARASRDPGRAGIVSTLESPRHRAIRTLQAAITVHELQGESATPISMTMAVGQYVIPNRDALEKILRYETTIERSLDRALDRLERLQRRRMGEAVLPPVSVRLTQ